MAALALPRPAPTALRPRAAAAGVDLDVAFLDLLAAGRNSASSSDLSSRTSLLSSSS